MASASTPADYAIRNDDICDLCKKLGHLVCCERCPHSYHKSCLAVHWAGSQSILDRLRDEDVLECKMLKLRCTARKERIKAMQTMQILPPTGSSAAAAYVIEEEEEEGENENQVGSPAAAAAYATEEDEDENENSAAGLAALDDEDICIALRSAMHVKGPTNEALSKGALSMLADRYIHSRTFVNTDTAAAVLLKSYTDSEVIILRNFSGAMPAAYGSVSQLLSKPPPREREEKIVWTCSLTRGRASPLRLR